jgi:hypothetical protein
LSQRRNITFKRKDNTNIMRFLLYIITFLTICCGQLDFKAIISPDKNNILYTTANSTKEKSHYGRQKEASEINCLDSIRQSKIMKTALTIAKQNRSKDYYKYSFESSPDDSSYVETTELILGNLFSNDKKHLLIRRLAPWCTFLDLFLIKNDSLISVVNREQGGMTYVSDTIFDANGDKQKDFIVHWYPSSGCCRRNIYNVYLYDSNYGTFSTDYEFINPTFSPNEKIIRGIGYGHPGEVELYKYKWKGIQVDTLEFIYPNADKKGTYIKTMKQTNRPSETEGIILNSIPKEYQSIESYDWFISEE